MKSIVLAFLTLAVLAVPAPAPAKAAAARDWSRTVVATPQGGYRMGNPAARMKLVEYGSLTCPHCRAFDQKGLPVLVAGYVRSGKLSYEFRNYVRDALDMSAALVARCGGATKFFPVSRALYADQPTWMGKLEGADKATIERLQALPKERMFLEAAKLAGLQAYAGAKGVTTAQTTRCLTDPAAIDRLAGMVGKAKSDQPDLSGTPSFVLNGRLLPNVHDWDSLRSALAAAER